MKNHKSIKDGSNALSNNININQSSLIIISIFWIYCGLLIILLFGAYIYGLLNNMQDHFLVIALVLLVLTPASFLFLSTSRLLFGRKPLIIATKGGVLLPKIRLFVDKHDVKTIYYKDVLSNKNYMIVVNLKNSNKKYIIINFLFPIIFATPKTIYFNVLLIANKSNCASRKIISSLDGSRTDRS